MGYCGKRWTEAFLTFILSIYLRSSSYGLSDLAGYSAIIFGSLTTGTSKTNYFLTSTFKI
jgi:hypothetical protein